MSTQSTDMLEGRRWRDAYCGLQCKLDKNGITKMLNEDGEVMWVIIRACLCRYGMIWFRNRDKDIIIDISKETYAVGKLAKHPHSKSGYIDCPSLLVCYHTMSAFFFLKLNLLRPLHIKSNILLYFLLNTSRKCQRKHQPQTRQVHWN